MQIKIDKDIPMPTFRQGRKLEWPWEKMEVGDSVKVDKSRIGAAEHSFRYYQQSRGNGVRFQRQTVNNEIRIWRVS